MVLSPPLIASVRKNSCEQVMPFEASFSEHSAATRYRVLAFQTERARERTNWLAPARGSHRVVASCRESQRRSRLLPSSRWHRGGRWQSLFPGIASPKL